jgi:hypothetical protein
MYIIEFQIFMKSKLEAIMTVYSDEFETDMETDIRNNFEEHLIPFFLQRIRKTRKTLHNT